MIRYFKNQIGKPHDFSFNTSNITKFHCSELIYMIKSVTGESPLKLKIKIKVKALAIYKGDLYERTS